MYCKYCGAEVPNGAAFCPNCGKPVGSGAAAAPAQPAAPAPKKKSGGKIAVLAAVLVLLAAAAALGVWKFGVPYNKYKQAAPHGGGLCVRRGRICGPGELPPGRRALL